MKQNGQFLLFDTAIEFREWLFKQKFNRSIWRIQQHHTYLPDYKGFSGNNHFAMLESMDYYHEHNGFSDIAQNITTFPDGKIAVCRPFDVMPAGIMGGNEGALTYENIGNFDVEDMTKEQFDIIIESVKAICERFSIVASTNTIEYHHWYDLNTGRRTSGLGVTKTCPGRKFFGGNTVEACQNYFIPLLKGEQITVPKTEETTMLKKGDNGQAVKDLQTKLNILGYNLVVDGDFGSLTTIAIMDFQKNSNLTADGLCGPMTMDKIDDAIKTMKSPALDLQAMYDDLLVKYEAVKTILANTKKALEG